MAACLSSGVVVLSACVLANGDALHLPARFADPAMLSRC